VRRLHFRDILRVFVIVAISVTIFAPSVSWAAEPTAAELATQLDALNDRVRAAGREYDAAFWTLDETELRIERLDESLAQIEAELAERETALGMRVVSWYKRSDDDFLTFILGATSFLEMANRLELWERIAEQDAVMISDYKETRTAYKAELSALERERQRQATDVATLESKKNALEAEFSAIQSQYDRKKAELAAAIEREKARNNITYELPVGPNGMVFPVAGPNYYSDTWGASRSGGRRTHKGTDIMAAEGIPVVAILSGTVRSKEGGLGGKVIWLTADNGWTFYYAHLSGWAVRSGRVNAGQVIGYVGHTGNASASAPHLHFEIHPNGGEAVNPYPYLRQMQ